MKGRQLIMVILSFIIIFSTMTISINADMEYSNEYSTGLQPETQALGMYYTISSSAGSDAFHFQFPMIIRSIKPIGVSFVVIAIYTSMNANTTVVDRSGDIINDIHGPHLIFCHGFGILGFNGSFFKSPVWFTTISFIQPRIISFGI